MFFSKPDIEKLTRKKNINGLYKAIAYYAEHKYIDKVYLINISLANLGYAGDALLNMSILIKPDEPVFAIEAMEIVEIIFSVLKDPNKSELSRNSALYALISFLKIKIITDDDKELIQYTRSQLQGIGYLEVVNAIINCLSSFNKSLITKSIETLGILEDPQAIKFISPFLNDSDDLIRKNAELAMKNLKSNDS
jgi:HEAT repeat protein